MDLLVGHQRLRVLALRATGCDLTVVLDSPEQAAAVAKASREADDAIPVLIEIDTPVVNSASRPGIGRCAAAQKRRRFKGDATNQNQLRPARSLNSFSASTLSEFASHTSYMLVLNSFCASMLSRLVSHRS